MTKKKTEIRNTKLPEVSEKLPKLKNMPVADVADLLRELTTEEKAHILKRFTPVQQGLLVAEFPLEQQLNLMHRTSPEFFARLPERMPSGARADLFLHLKQNERDEILPYLSKSVRDNLIRLSAYDPETAGGIMSTDFATVSLDMTCGRAIAKVRMDDPSKRTVYYNYVVNENHELPGFITLKDLIPADPETPVEKVMPTGFVFSYADEDREEAAKKIEKYDLVALPVLNRKNQLIGTVTHDSAIDVIRAEQNEDLEKFMGMVQAGEEFNYVRTNTSTQFKKRVVWEVSFATIPRLLQVLP